MASALSLSLTELPPSANSIWRAVNGRVLKSRDYRAWMQATALVLRSQARGGRIEGPYAMHVQLVAPDRRRRDLDNRLKALSDAITAAGLVDDDSFCRRIEAEWVPEGPSVRVWLVSTKGD